MVSVSETFENLERRKSFIFVDGAEQFAHKYLPKPYYHTKIFMDHPSHLSEQNERLHYTFRTMNKYEIAENLSKLLMQLIRKEHLSI